MFHWPFLPSSTLYVQGQGYWLAVVGMIISVVGFAITLTQLSRTKKATEAVSKEVKRIEFAVLKYDASIETSRAETALEAIKKGVRNGDWRQATDDLESLSKALHTLRQLEIPELLQHAASIDSIMTHANRTCERLDKAGDQGLEETETNKTLSKLREHDKIITSLRIALHRSNLSE
ncbi:MAG: hypothetical protein EON58_18110 [Alphaproteobacteria bacterium]|nr:MAG: hypothetical protein EON58_18110 [Alphaproteobacteria bacterium]